MFSMRQSDRQSQMLRELTAQQYLHPHKAVAETVEAACARQGYGIDTGKRAIALVGLRRDAPVGRLAREQIRLLADGIEGISGEMTKETVQASAA